MKELIDKAEVVAEIKSLMCTTFTNFDEGVNAAAKTLLESIDNLEVKEVDYNDCIHKDAFIDKACEWLKENADHQRHVVHPAGRHGRPCADCRIHHLKPINHKKNSDYESNT